MGKGKFILLEGLDGTGKTTIANELAKKHNYVLFHSPDCRYKVAAEYVHSCNYYTQLLYYMGANFDISDQITASIENNNVICDKYYLTTIVSFITFCEAQEDLTQLFNSLLEKLQKPDYIIYLTASPEVRQLRLRSRKQRGAYDKKFEESIKLQVKADTIFQEYLKQNYDNFSIIDTSGDISDTLDKIEAVVEEVWK